MAGVKGLQQYENVPEQVLTLTEVNEKITEYPAIVRVVPKEYEIPNEKELLGDEEILLEKPKCLQFVLVRILGFDDEQQIKAEKGEDFIDQRNRYVGKEFLLPVGYQGTFKLISKTGRDARYISVNQIIRDLPRFIRINQETTITPPHHSSATSTLAAGTTLEVKRVSTVEKVRYIKCKSLKTSRKYIFKEGIPINCTAVEDPNEHTFLNMAGEFILLPKTAQFQNVWADDVILKDDDEAVTMLTLTGGPIKILKIFLRRNVYIAWMKPEGKHKTVALIPEQIWNNQFVQLKVFSNESNRNEYIKQHFGEARDSNFIVSGLYWMKQIETDVVWLQAPKDKMAAEKLVDYENIEKILADYEDVTIGNENDDTEDYEKPAPQVQDAPSIPPKPVLLPPEVPSAPPPALNREPILLPTAKVRKEDILQKIKEKAKIGFDKVHEQLLKRTKQKSMQAKEGYTGDKKQKQSVLYSRSKSESGELRQKKGAEKKSLSKSVSDGDDKGVDDKSSGGHLSTADDQSQRLSKAFEVNRYRPLPALPPKPNTNVTDDDKLEMYDDDDDKEDAFLKEMETIKLQKASNTNLDTLARYPDLNKIGRAKQTDEDFYSYTVEELVECLKMCSLDKFAIDCSANKLDGGFFRGFDLNVLKSEPFCLSNLDVFKVKKIINEGWRPKCQHVLK